MMAGGSRPVRRRFLGGPTRWLTVLGVLATAVAPPVAPATAGPLSRTASARACQPAPDAAWADGAGDPTAADERQPVAPEAVLPPAEVPKASVASARLALQSQGRSAAPGGFIPGTVTILGGSGPPHSVRLVVRDIGPGTVVSVSPPQRVLSDAGSSRFDFRLYFAPNTIVGANSATLLVTDDVDPSVVYDHQRLLAWVEKPSTPLDPLRWQWVAVAAFLAVAAVVLLGCVGREEPARRRRGWRSARPGTPGTGQHP